MRKLREWVRHNLIMALIIGTLVLMLIIGLARIFR